MTGYFKPFDRARCGWDRDSHCERRHSRHYSDYRTYRSYRRHWGW